MLHDHILFKSLLIVLLLFDHFVASSQQFTQVQGGRIVSTRSDSRSVNFCDINNDGWEDIFISNGLQNGQKDLLYLNDGSGSFSEIRGEDLVESSLSSVGATFADFDNDGNKDAFVTNWYGQKDALFRNNGNNSFTLQDNNTVSKGTFAEAAAWGDFDNDGLLDLYVTNSSGSKKNFLYRNTGNGMFEEITEGIAVNDVNTSRSVNWIFANEDEFLDLFVTNENNEPNILYLGNGDGTFSSQVISAGRNSFSSSWGDVDSDGDFDLFIGNTGITRGAGNKLFINENGEFIQNLEGTIHLDGGCTNGSAFGDFDNDGDLDLVVTNGFCDDQRNFIYENQGNGVLIKNDEILGNIRDVCSYGVAWGDVNNDGFIDLVIANCKKNGNDFEQTNDFYLNDGNDNGWLKINLEGIESNKDAIGAIVKLKSTIQGKSIWQTRMVSSQSGYSGQNSKVVHFGLGDAEMADSIIVLWPSGEVNIKTKVSHKRTLNIVEGISTSSIEIEKNDYLNIKTWPNPISIQESNILTVSVDRQNLQFNDDVSISLINFSGQTILSNHLNVGGEGEKLLIQLTLSNKQLQPGKYLLRTLLGRKEHTEKILAF